MSLDKVQIKLLTSTAKVIARDSQKESIGYDIYSDEDKYIPGYLDVIQKWAHQGANWYYSLPSIPLELNNVQKIKTGISLSCPIEYGEFIKDKSSKGACGLSVLGGVVDGSYRGEVLVVLGNLGPLGHWIEKGEKIAQLVFIQVELPKVEIVKELPQSTRGTGSFGSTGKR